MSRAVMQQALEVLEGLADYRYTERVKNTMASLRAALAEPEQESISLNNGRLTQYPDGSIGVGTPAEPEQEPCAMRYDFDGYGYRYIDSGSGSNWQTRHKDAEPLYTRPYDQTALELCGVCGWRTLIPGDACLNCERGKPEQEPVGQLQEEAFGRGQVLWFKKPADQSMLYTAPTPQREHITDGSPCWCNPDVIEESGGNVVIHNYEDNWQQYAKPGETAQQCIERHRGEQDALMKLYATPRKPLTDEEMRALVGNVADIGGAIRIARAIEAAHGITGE